MNEAENSNNSPDLFESNESQNASAQVDENAPLSVTPLVKLSEAQTLVSGEWETVNFPDALSVDDIPQAELQQAAVRIQDLEQQHTIALIRVETLEQEQSTAIARIQTLEHHNRELLTQTARLEEALDQSRKAIRLERRRWKAQALSQIAQAEERSQAQEAILAQKNQELSEAQDYSTRLFQELEQSHQTAQKQQILIETLTGQLEARQEQIAQLERECALTQQRHDDQIQFVRQAETSCRDLQSRLHRQQRYTLQFKSALEKCLDVPTPQSQVHFSEPPTIAVAKAENAPIQLFAPKAPPVKPWSAQPDFLAIAPQPPEAEIAAELNSLPVVTSAVWGVETASPEASQPEVPSVPEVLVTDVVEAPAVAAPSFVSYTIARSSGETVRPSEASDDHWNVQLFDPQPAAVEVETQIEEANLFEAEQPEIDRDLEQKLDAALQTLESSSNPVATELSRMIQLSDRAEEPLESELESLSETPVIDEVALTPPVSVEETVQLAEAEHTEADSPITVTETVVEPLDALHRESLITPFEQVMLDHFTDASPELAAFVTLHQAEDSPKNQETEVATSTAMPFHGNGPSPIVYPLRSTKKRKSLAAVELPSFPRRGS